MGERCERAGCRGRPFRFLGGEGRRPPLWRYPEAAAHLGISVQAARSRKSRGSLPAPEDTTVPGRPRWKPATLTGWKPLDRDAVHQAVQLLDQIPVIRNSAIHPKPRPELASAHHALGLSFPVRDFTAAWDSVRAHAERAVGDLQEAIQSARP
ncbi:hypothetical protein [Streptomyces sp. NPDC058664]|uniref:hypothetical protein n=1 Tax=unclassified Streptomyces TaxID=2593676 RepID=UPI003653E049